jgi:formylglycine-generating enzyme required for sulfatase activity
MSNPEDLSPDGWMKLPVEMINWYEAIVFCNKLSLMENLNPVYRVDNSTNPDDWGDPPETIRHRAWDVEMISGANGYRLPTEAEGEYAARGGGSSRGFAFAGNNNARIVSWFYDNSEFKSHEIGKKEPNELGLYDMSGNVMEWCWEWLGDYTADPKDNPVGPPSGLYRVIRGGGWSVTAFYGRVAYRHNNNPYYRGINLGLRVAQSQ